MDEQQSGAADEGSASRDDSQQAHRGAALEAAFEATVTSAGIGGLSGTFAGLVWGGVGGRVAMRIVFLTSDDGDRLLATLSRGDHFGEQAVFGGVRRNATVRAKTQLDVLSLGAAEALAMSEALPGFGDHVRRLPDSTGDTGPGDGGTQS